MIRVLVACEFSGTVRDAFTKRGFHAVSCDLLPTESPGLHYQGDCLDLLEGWEPAQDADLPTHEYKSHNGILLARPLAHPRYDLMVAHPPCTYLAASGLHWNTRTPGRLAKSQEALEFVIRLMTAPIRHIAVENPIGLISTTIRRFDQKIQPWQFGHSEAKATCLWLQNLPPLKPTCTLVKPPRGYWENQTASGQSAIWERENRWKVRAITYPGIAAAMAFQWGRHITNARHTKNAVE